MLKVYPYLNFDGDCEEALRFYQSVLGGELSRINRFSEMPGGEKVPEEEKERVMHMSLDLNEDYMIMGSDIVPSMGHKLNQGNNNYVMIVPDSDEEGKRVFEGLSVGGKVEMPYEKQFWGDSYGSFTDKYGVKWMVNYGEPKEG